MHSRRSSATGRHHTRDCPCRKASLQSCGASRVHASVAPRLEPQQRLGWCDLLPITAGRTARRSCSAMPERRYPPPCRRGGPTPRAAASFRDEPVADWNPRCSVSFCGRRYLPCPTRSSLEAKKTDENPNGLGGRWVVVANGRRIRRKR
jgi:hypothetical protein